MLDTEFVAALVDRVDVDYEAICYTRRQLAMDFHFLEKSGSRYLSNSAATREG